jgi:hypothetical protein
VPVSKLLTTCLKNKNLQVQSAIKQQLNVPLKLDLKLDAGKMVQSITTNGDAIHIRPQSMPVV